MRNLAAMLLILAAVVATGCSMLRPSVGTGPGGSVTWCDRLSAGLRIADTVAVPALTAAGVLAPGVAGPAATAYGTVTRLAPLVTGWCSKPANPATIAQDASDLAAALAVVLAEYQARSHLETPGQPRAVDVSRTQADMEALAAELATARR